MKRANVNPFRFDGPLPRHELIGRERAVDTLVGCAIERRVLCLAAPRRYGKTSLLRAAAEVLTTQNDFVVAHVDLQALAGIEDFVSRFGSAWRAATNKNRRARRAFETVAGGLSSFGVSVLGAGVQFQRRDDNAQNVLSVVHTLLDLPGQVEEPVLVVLDEFQDLHGVWPEGEGVLRSHTQSPAQAGRVAYAFAGSEPSLLAAAFEDRGRAYYQQVLRIPVGRLPSSALAVGIADRFEATGRTVGTALVPLLDLADGHPQRAMLLAHLLWEHTPHGGSGDDHWPGALKQARSLTADEAAGIWQSLSPTQRQTLQVVIDTGSATARTGTAPRSSSQRAAESLRASGLLEPDGTTGPRGGTRLRVVDPLLADWVRQRRA